MRRLAALPLMLLLGCAHNPAAPAEKWEVANGSQCKVQVTVYSSQGMVSQRLGSLAPNTTKQYNISEPQPYHVSVLAGGGVTCTEEQMKLIKVTKLTTP
jgi:hypothetical protein